MIVTVVANAHLNSRFRKVGQQLIQRSCVFTLWVVYLFKYMFKI